VIRKTRRDQEEIRSREQLVNSEEGENRWMSVRLPEDRT
jgi:hypothetical protein